MPPRRENKRKQCVIAHALDQAQRVLKFFLRLAGEADDDIGREHELRHKAAAVIHELKILRARIAAVHGVEHAVVSRLERQMELLADLRIGRDGVKQLMTGVLGMGRHEAQAKIARQARDLRHEVGEIHAEAEVLAVGIDVLAEQRDLLIALRDQRAALCRMSSGWRERSRPRT